MTLDFTAKGKLSRLLVSQLNEIAQKNRKKYNRLIQDLTNEYENNIDFWASDLASRNTLSNNLFLQLCYLELVWQLINEQKIITVIITDSKELNKSLQSSTIIKEHNIEVIFKMPLKDRLKSFVLPFFTYGFKLLRIIRHFWAASFTRMLFNGTRKIMTTHINLVDIFLFDHSFQDNRYKDRYYNRFSALGDDFKYYYIYNFINIRKYFSIFKEIRTSKDNFLIREDFLKISDWFFALLYPFRVKKLVKKNISFQGFNIAGLIQDICRKNIYTNSSFYCLLNYKFAQRLKENNIKVKLLIDWFENQAIDKSLHLAFATFMPETYRIAYQIVIDNKFYLCFYPTTHEKEANVLPHKLYICGQGNKKSVTEFCPTLKVEVAPAFRYQHVWNKREFEPQKDTFTILLVLPITLQDTTDILLVVKQMLVTFVTTSKKNVQFWVKQHPSYTQKQISNLITSWPVEFEFVTGNFNEMIEKANIIIGSNSSTSIETLAKGIPVIIIGSQSGLTQNPIPKNITADIWKLCYTSDELAKTITYYMNQTTEDKARYQKIGEQIRKDYFEPVTREGVRRFLQLD